MELATRLNTVSELDTLRERAVSERASKDISISICAGTGCRAQGSMDLFDEFRRLLLEGGLKNVTVRATGCHGFCEKGPLVVVHPKKIFYHGVQVKHVAEIIAKTIREDQPVEALLFKDPVSKKKCLCEHDVPFYAKQQRIVLRNIGIVDPGDIDDYIAADGYAALSKVLTGMRPEGVIETITKAGLRGRGGGGFPTGRKWDVCRSQPGDVKFVFCNGDEGDPGAFMDRSIMEGDPHSVLEGMTIGGYAIGASQGFIYVRAEYPLAVSNMNLAIDQARSLGLLGKNILGSGFDFDVSIKIGAGAFVCGEETALIASAEGRVGEPRPRPPYPAQQGYLGKPTVINNVKTWATVARIIDKGWEWFAGTGTETSKGTAVFCITGDIQNTGLAEVPLGMTLEQIVFDVGGGPKKKKRTIKAVQTGGPSGGCIPRRMFDLPVDYERLTQAGSMMGSGGMIIVDDTTCMVSLAKYFLNFTMDESCGKCTPCREGTRRMHALLEKMTNGEATEEDLALLEELAAYVKDSSLCGLGSTAPNPVLSTLNYFRDEYEAHVKEKRCPAGACVALIKFVVDPEKCTVCGACTKVCPVNAVPKKVDGTAPVIDQVACTRCRSCFDVCPTGAIFTDKRDQD